MSNNRTYIYLFISLVVLLAGCNRVKPQRPSQRMGETPNVDSMQMAILEMNTHLISAADEQIRQWVQLQDEHYAQYDFGVWAHIDDAGDTDGPTYQHNDECAIHMRVYSLDGHLYCDQQKTARAERFELPMCIDTHLSEWHRGAKIRLFAPWYAAYGMQGTDVIPPYENVKIEFELR